MNGKDILQAIGLLAKAPKDQVEKALSDFDVTEAIKADAMHLKAGEEVKDIYEDNHAVPSREEINMGPSESASGAGAKKMIADYSNVAPQVGVQLDYERVANMMSEFVKAQKAQTEAISKQSALLVRMADAMVSKAEDDDKEDGDEEEEASEKARVLTETLLRKADDVIGKADKLGEKLDATKSAKSKTLIQSRIDRLMKDATSLLEKARRGVMFVNDEALTDAFNDIAVKAEADLVDEDDDDKDEKKASKKAEEVHQQADGQDDDDNQPAASETSKAILARVEKALSGMEVMHGEVKDIFDVMSSSSRGKVVSTSALAKSKAPVVDDDDKLFDRMSKTVLSQDETVMVDNLISMRAMVKGGARSPVEFATALKNVPDNVKEIFA